MIGIEIVSDKVSKAIFDPKLDLAHKIEAEARKNGLIILSGVPGLVDGVGGDHLELCPPYIINDDHVEFIVSILKKSILETISSITSKFTVSPVKAPSRSTMCKFLKP